MKDFKYIIKRVIIGVGIALVLSLLRGNLLIGVSAKTINTLDLTADYQATAELSTTNTITVPLSSYNFGSNLSGDLTFSFVLYNGGQGLAYPLLNGVNVYSGSSNVYHCSFGTVSTSSSGNNTAIYNKGAVSYSATCPVNLTENGLTHIQLSFLHWDSSSTGYFTFSLNRYIQLTSDSTQEIIDNQNENTEKEIESQKVCKNLSYTLNEDNGVNGNLKSNGEVDPSPNYRTTSDFIYIRNYTDVSISRNHTGNIYERIAFYKQDKTFISYIDGSGSTQNLILPSNAYYLRFSVDIRNNGIATLTGEFCQNGNQAIADSQQELNDTINNDDVTGASGEASSFFDDFTVESHGISGVITAPLRLINSLTTAQCSPLTFQLPFIHDQVVLPCMRGIYEQYFGVFFSLYQLITTGLICYATLINLYSKIHNLQNPYNDRIEVLNL